MADEVLPFAVNVYSSSKIERMIDLDPDLTDQGQSQSVREILKRFSRNEIEVENSRTAVKGEYAAEFADDEPLDSDTVQTLLDMPDTSGMDEMDVMDFISENTEATSREKLFARDDPPKNDPPKNDPPKNVSENKSEPAPSE